LIFALKEKNRGKIDSHWWFFNAFCQDVNPEYCFLLDVGTVPNSSAFYELYHALERNTDVAGCCGELTTLDGCKMGHPLVAAQRFEYKVANILDKAMESAFGYISVLPGAFSAYRYEALLGEPLERYFHHLTTPLEKARPFESNMYLAEDRILCYELVAKKGQKYILEYVKNAQAKTDVPNQLPALIKQRRRWLNGSLFALLYALLNWQKIITQTAHPWYRKVSFCVQFLFYILVTTMSWFSIAIFYVTFYLVLKNMLGNAFLYVAAPRYTFMGLIVLQILLGLGNKPHRVKSLYNVSAALFGMLLIMTTVFGVIQLATANKGISINVVLSVLGTVGGIFIISAFYSSFETVLLSFVPYLFYSCTWIVVFPIYSLCNLHDVSWGTKDIDSANISDISHLILANKGNEEQVQALLRQLEERKAKWKSYVEIAETRFERFRTNVLLGWVITNGLFVGFITNYADEIGVHFLEFVTMAMLAFTGFKLIGSIIYLVRTYYCRSEKPKIIYPNVESA